MKSNTGLEGESEVRLQICVHMLRGGEHPQTRPDGLACALFMIGVIQSEKGKHAVAEVFVDDAVIGENRVAELLKEAVEGVDEIVGELALSDSGEIANVAEEKPDSFLLCGGPAVDFATGEVGIDGVMYNAADLGRASGAALASEPDVLWPTALRRQLSLLRRARAE